MTITVLLPEYEAAAIALFNRNEQERCRVMRVPVGGLPRGPRKWEALSERAKRYYVALVMHTLGAFVGAGGYMQRPVDSQHEANPQPALKDAA